MNAFYINAQTTTDSRATGDAESLGDGGHEDDPEVQGRVLTNLLYSDYTLQVQHLQHGDDRQAISGKSNIAWRC